MGSIDRAPNGKGWKARWRTPDGKSRSRTFSRKIDAERHLVEVAHRRATGTYVDPAMGRTTFETYATRWLASQRHWRPSTRATTEYRLAAAIGAFGDRPLASIKTTDVKSWLAGLPGAASTVEATYRAFQQVLLAAVEDGLIGASPAPRRPSLPKRERIGDIKVLTVEEVRSLANAVPDRYRAAVLVAAATGLRQGELLGLTVDRVDWLRRSARIDRQLVASPDGPTFGPTKTAAGVRTVPLAAVTVEALSAHLAQYPEGPNGLIFTGESGGPVRRQRVIEIWTKACAATNVAARWHDLRHHAASLLIASGCSVKAVQEVLGHADAAETLKTYAHLWPTDHDQVREAIERAWRAPVVGHALDTGG